MAPIIFQITSDAAAQSVTFSLTCTSNGGPINTMVWEKDFITVPGSNIYPDLNNSNTATYTNTLQVSGRESGNYTCKIADGNSLSLSESLIVQGIQ